MEKIKRMSASIPASLFEEFERTRKELGEKKRSRAIAEAIYEYISINRWTKLEGKIDGVIVACSEKEGMESMFEIEEIFHDAIRSCFHVRLSGSSYLWLIVFSGESKRIKELAKRVGREKCIKSLRVFALRA